MDFYRKKRAEQINRKRNRGLTRNIRIILLDNAEKIYKTTKDKKLLNSIKQKIEFIKNNPFYGNNIPKDRMPRSYNCQNLWRTHLHDYWRLLYTIKGDEKEIICFIVDILNHKDYNKKFGYRKK